MTKTLQAKNITLHYLKIKFGIQLVEYENFFREWQDNLPEISEFDKQFLDRVRASYFNLVEYPPMLETTVKMVVVSPLMHLAGFYLPPFHFKVEPEVDISFEDEEEIFIKGKIDILVLQERVWVLTIESKRVPLSLEAGLAQTLAYMLTDPDYNKPSFGLLTNGREFQFIKMVRQGTPQYALSDSFSIRDRGNKLYEVLRIMKRLAQIVGTDE